MVHRTKLDSPDMILSKPLLALAVASFGIGTTEFVIMGLLPEVASDLNVSIPAAGMLISGYALGVTFGSPIMVALMNRMARKSALLVLVAIFILGNFLCAVAPTYWLLMAARVLTALCHGTFFGIGAVVATQLVEPKQRTQAVAIMFSGLTLANVLGVPFGTALGQATGWRVAFAAIVPIGLIAALAIWRWVPKTADTSEQSFLKECRALARLAVVLPMLASILVSASLFSTFTYIAPLLSEEAGISAHGLTIMLLLFGFAITLGNLSGGRLADWRQLTALLLITAAMCAAALLFQSIATSFTGAAIGLALWGFIQFASGPSLQTRVVDGAVGAPNLASTLNQSAFNLGNAGGAWVGGYALSSGLPYGDLPLISAGTAALAFIVVACDALVTRQAARKTPQLGVLAKFSKVG